MEIKNFKIRNFRGIKEKSISKIEGISVISGDNGTGKTSLIRGIEGFLSGDFQKEDLNKDYSIEGEIDGMMFVRKEKDEVNGKKVNRGAINDMMNSKIGKNMQINQAVYGSTILQSSPEELQNYIGSFINKKINISDIIKEGNLNKEEGSIIKKFSSDELKLSDLNSLYKSLYNERTVKGREKKAAAAVPSAPSVTFEIKGLEIDLGGIAKGFTGDRVGEIFSRYNINSGIISLGGNVQAYGTKTNGKPWRVAIQNPESSMEYLGVLDVQDKAVVTSGGYERFFEENGVRYHHIIDPRTGYPADSGLISATIVCEKGILADGLSTSLFIMGKDQAEKFWRESDLYFDYILEDKEGTLYVTEGIADSLMTDAKVEVVYR